MASNWSGYVYAGQDLAKTAIALAKNNPAIAGVAALGAGSLTILAAPGVAVTPIITTLQYIGFGAGGIVGGS